MYAEMQVLDVLFGLGGGLPSSVLSYRLNILDKSEIMGGGANESYVGLKMAKFEMNRSWK